MRSGPFLAWRQATGQDTGRQAAAGVIWMGMRRQLMIVCLVWTGLFAVQPVVAARDWYVATNSVPGDADRWSNAFTNLQDALALAEPGDTIRVAGHTFAGNPLGASYPTNTVFLWQSATGMTVRGGYQADPALPPGDHPGTNNPSQWPTVLTRTTASNIRILTLVNASNILFHGVTVTNGYSSENNRGGGVHLASCRDVTFADCRILANQARKNSNSPMGGGLYLAASRGVMLTNSVVASNVACYNTGGDTGAFGGGAYIDGTSELIVIRSFFLNNETKSYGKRHGSGGAVYVAASGRFDVRETVFASNLVTRSNASYQSYGGAIDNRGMLELVNCLVVSNRSDTSHSDGINAGGGTSVVFNCTIADNYAVGVRYGAGTIAVSNSIVWGHSTRDLLDLPEDPPGVSKLPSLWYSCTGDGWNTGHQGCQSTDPLFAERAAYHLQSSGGHYTNGYFVGGEWTVSAGNSPLIDRGDPESGFSREPEPHGDRVNMGAYGNTEVASKTPDIVVALPSASNDGALAWGRRTVTLRGTVTGTGGEIPDAWFHYWIQDDAVTNTMAFGLQDGAFSAAVSGLTPGTNYAYLVAVSNRAGLVLSAPSPFATHPAVSALYVATNGSHTAGTNWSTAYNHLQTALDMAEAGDTIYLAGHTFGDQPLRTKDTTLPLPYDTVYWWEAVSNATLSGGYAATDDAQRPGNPDPDQWPSVLTRTSGDGRILHLSGLSNVVFRGIVITNGYTASDAGDLGGGVRLVNCAEITFDNCRIGGNQARRSTNPGAMGGGLHLAGSSVTLTNCLVVGNGARKTGGDTPAYGGGAYVDGSSRLTVRRSLFVGNDADANGGRHGFGGAVYVATSGQFDAMETVFSSNLVKRTNAGYNSHGGAIDNRGLMQLVNCLVVSNRSDTSHSDGIYAGGGTSVVVNCTIADNYAVGVRYGAGTIAVSNSIVWGHSTRDLLDLPEDPPGVSKLPSLWYSCTGDGWNSGFQGCMSTDPLFADRETYHLQSTAGHYTSGYFDGGAWTVSAGNSPLIDRGNPASDWSREPEPHGDCINMGAYGNTEVASKTADIEVDPPTVANDGALAWGHRTVTLRGTVTDTGSEIPDVWFRYWILGDAVTNEVAQGPEDGAFSASVSGLTPGTNYAYLVAVSNRAGLVLSDASAFVTHPAGSALYVATNGSHTAGTNWSTAYNHLQTALDMAEAGDTIYLAGHTFGDQPLRTKDTTLPLPYDTVYWWEAVSNVTLSGGYAATDDAMRPGAHDPDQWPTVLTRTSGDGRILHLSGLSNVVFRGIVITNGYTESGAGDLGGGVRLVNCAEITFDNCRIGGNQARRSTNPGAMGGGLFLSGSYVTLTNCQLIGNVSTYTGGDTPAYGGGVYIDGNSDMVSVSSRFLDNQAHSYGARPGSGGAVYVAAGGQFDARETVFSGNRVTRGASWDQIAYGGALDNRGALDLVNCLVVSNYSYTGHGDGINAGGGTSVVGNCTVAGNFAVGIRYGAGTLGVTNSIIWGHSTADLLELPVTDDVLDHFSHSLYGTATTGGEAVNMHEIEGCIVGDPKFIGEGDHPYSLQKGSPAINAGINLDWITVASLDLAGNRRKVGGNVDMGAYEATGIPGSMFMFR